MKDKLTKNPIDALVSQRVRERRLALGMSQDKLANAVGVSFQQIQKYENGTNRVAGGRLQLIADALQMPVAWFFSGEEFSVPTETGVSENAPAGLDDRHLTSPESLELLKLYYSLPNDERQALLAELKAKAVGQTS